LLIIRWCSFHGERTEWPVRHRPTHPWWVTLEGVIVPFENQRLFER
jgi:hypothetical protein